MQLLEKDSVLYVEGPRAIQAIIIVEQILNSIKVRQSTLSLPCYLGHWQKVALLSTQNKGCKRIERES